MKQDVKEEFEVPSVLDGENWSFPEPSKEKDKP